jgi:hypothetical protein
MQTVAKRSWKIAAPIRMPKIEEYCKERIIEELRAAGYEIK